MGGQHVWDCSKVQSEIVARQEGWLSPRDAAAFDQHVAGCQVCRKQLDADTELRRALEVLGAKEVLTPSWPEVRDRNRATPSGRLPKWLLAPALGVALASLALIWITYRHAPTRIPKEPIVVADTLTSVAPATHMLMTASDLGADPNRAIVAASQLTGDR